VYFDRVGAQRLYVSTRPDPTSDAWAVATELETPLANLNGYVGPDFGPDDLRLVVVNQSTREIHEATRPDTSSAWGVPLLLPGLGGQLDDGYPCLRSDGLELFFESNRAPPLALYRATRPSLDAPFRAPERMSFGPVIDVAKVGDCDLSADGRELVFVSDATVVGGDFDLHLTTREPL
jgi:hypothetical protein